MRVEDLPPAVLSAARPGSQAWSFAKIDFAFGPFKGLAEHLPQMIQLVTGVRAVSLTTCEARTKVRIVQCSRFAREYCKLQDAGHDFRVPITLCALHRHTTVS
jgi:hypothetical protein